MAAWLQPPNSSLFDYKLGCAALQRTLFELFSDFSGMGRSISGGDSMKPKKWELMVLGVLLLGLVLWVFFPKQQGGAVTVTVNGEAVGSYSLAQELRQNISGYGDYRLTLVIDRGKAWVEDATCPDLICQHHAPVSQAGQQIICLPGRIVISVAGEEEAFDAIAQ
jgi:hypothetical protein